MRLDSDGQWLRVTVEDDGVGFVPEAAPGEGHRGLGLVGIRERAADLSGALIVESAPGRGTRLIVTIPLGLPSAEDPRAGAAVAVGTRGAGAAGAGGVPPQRAVISSLTAMSAFDLSQGKIDGFGSYRFLYERLIGAAVRPWLPAIYCGASALPHLHPDTRRRLLRAIDEAAAASSGWSLHEPQFMPEWVDKIEVAAA